MSLGTLSFEIEADDAGADDALDEIADRLESIDDQLGDMADSAEEAGEAMEDIGKKTGLALNMSAVKQFAKGIKELGGFIFDAAKQAAEAGDGEMKDFVGNVDKLHDSFMKVGAQAASQLAPILQSLTDYFTNSSEAAETLRQTGNFLAGVFKVLATVGVTVIAIFDAVGTAIAGVASMIVDVLSGNMEGAAETWKALGTEMEGVWDRMASRYAGIWEEGAEDFDGPISKQKKGPAKLTSDEKKQIAADKLNQEVETIESLVDERKAEAAAIGDTKKQFELATRGTADFTEAMQAYETGAKQAAQLRNEAAQLEIEGSLYLAAQKNAEAAAVEASAQKDLKAAEAHKAALEAEVNTFHGAMSAFAGGVLKAIPRLNELVQAAQQGASVGGVWGALIAVLLQLISETEGFQKVIDVVNGDLDQLLDALGPLVSALSSLMEAVDPLTTIITALVRVALMPLVAIIQGLSIAVDWVIIGFMKFGEWINNLNAFRPKADKEAQAAQIAAREAAAHQKARDAEATLKKMWDDSVKEWKTALDPATAAVDDFKEAATAATEALLNVPVGYKVAAQRFAESQALGQMTMVQLGMGLIGALLGNLIPHMAEGGIVDRPTLAIIGEAGPEAVVPLGRGGAGAGGGISIENLTIVTPDPEDFLRKLRRISFTKTGAAFG